MHRRLPRSPVSACHRTVPHRPDASRPFGGCRASCPSSASATAATGQRPPAACLPLRSEEHTSELKSLMRISYAVFCLKKKKKTQQDQTSLTILRIQHIYEL